jgi:hypothetical protein
VGAGSGGRSLRHRAGEEGDRGQHRSRKAARPRLLAPDHQPTRPSDRSEREAEGALAPASVAEVVRLYGLRMWGEQSYKQVKPVLGWSDLPPDSTAGEEDACVLAGSPEGSEGMAGALDDL